MDNKVNKKDLAYFIAEKYDLKKGVSEDVIESLFLKIEHELRNKNQVSIVGFGTFYTKKLNARISTNPQTGEKFNKEERTIAKFKLGKKLNNMFKNKKDL
jgi:nucleoid DNA-binding protein